MSTIKKSISIILATVIFTSVLIISPINAGAAVSISHEEFDVRSPIKSGVYDVNEAIKIEIYRKKWIGAIINGYLVNDYNDIYIDILKGDDVKKSLDVTSYYTYNGTVHTESFTPKETGEYTVRVKLVRGSRQYLDIGSYNFTVVKRNNNTITVKTSKKTLKAKALKKAKKTVKPLTIKKAKGKVTVVKVKKGTSAKIFKKISVNKKDGALTFKKGKYKKGTYKVKFKITAAGNKSYKSKTLTKAVKIKIK